MTGWEFFEVALIVGAGFSCYFLCKWQEEKTQRERLERKLKRMTDAGAKDNDPYWPSIYS